MIFQFKGPSLKDSVIYSCLLATTIHRFPYQHFTQCSTCRFDEILFLLMCRWRGWNKTQSWPLVTLYSRWVATNVSDIKVGRSVGCGQFVWVKVWSVSSTPVFTQCSLACFSIHLVTQIRDSQTKRLIKSPSAPKAPFPSDILISKTLPPTSPTPPLPLLPLPSVKRPVSQACESQPCTKWPIPRAEEIGSRTKDDFQQNNRRGLEEQWAELNTARHTTPA